MKRWLRQMRLTSNETFEITYISKLSILRYIPKDSQGFITEDWGCPAILEFSGTYNGC